MIVTLVVAPLALIGVMRFGEGETQQWLTEESEAHRRWLEQWRAGGFPKDASGQRIAALADRAGGAEAERIRAYCLLKTELVLAAERELQDHDRKVAPDERARLRAKFAELAELRRDMGRSGVCGAETAAALQRQRRMGIGGAAGAGRT